MKTRCISPLSVRLLSAVLGVDFTEEQVQAKANRIADLEQEINQRFGIALMDDSLPERFLKVPSRVFKGKCGRAGCDEGRILFSQ